MIENRVLVYLYNKLFSKSNEEKLWSFNCWLGPLLFIKILLKTAQLLSKHFLSGFFLFVSFISFFIKARILMQFLSPAFSIFFRFHKCFNNFRLSKNILINKFFHWSICFFILLPPWRKGVVGFSLK